MDHNRDVLATKLNGQEKTYALRDSENMSCHVAVTGTTINLVNARGQRRFRIDFQDFGNAGQNTTSCLCLPIFDEYNQAPQPSLFQHF